MVTNPIQRKARNSFLLGILVAILIMGVVVAILLMQIMKMKQAENDKIANSKTLYVLNQDIKSGDTISTAKLTSTQIEKNLIPSNAASSNSLTENTVAKIDLKKGTILTAAMLDESNETTSNDLRTQEYNMINLSSQLAGEDYIDIRLRMPSGLDYIVVSKKRIEIPLINGIESTNTVWLKLTEAETLLMSNAIVEAYMNEGAVLYTAKYVDPGMQEQATPTYVPSANVQNLMSQNPNITQEAKNQLFTRYNANTATRNSINAELSPDSSESKDKVKTGVTTEVQTTKEQRKAYLDALAGK